MNTEPERQRFVHCSEQQDSHKWHDSDLQDDMHTCGTAPTHSSLPLHHLLAHISHQLKHNLHLLLQQQQLLLANLSMDLETMDPSSTWDWGIAWKWRIGTETGDQMQHKTEWKRDIRAFSWCWRQAPESHLLFITRIVWSTAHTRSMTVEERSVCRWNISSMESRIHPVAAHTIARTRSFLDRMRDTHRAQSQKLKKF